MYKVTMKSILSILALVSCVLADYAINNPVAGAVWKAGNNVDIAWYEFDGANPSDASISLTLVKGDANDLKSVVSLGSSSISSLKSTATLPGNLQSGTDYAVKITGPGGALKFSHFFEIIGDPSAPKPKSVLSTSSLEESETKPTPTTITDSKSNSSSKQSDNKSSKGQSSESTSSDSTATKTSTSDESSSDKSKATSSAKSTASSSKNATSSSSSSFAMPKNSYSFGFLAALITTLSIV